MNNYFLTLGSALVTILALVPTLTIIPIQRASETWSYVVMRLYKEDRCLRIVFLSIAFSAGLCFVLGFPKIHTLFWSFCVIIKQ